MREISSSPPCLQDSMFIQVQHSHGRNGTYFPLGICLVLCLLKVIYHSKTLLCGDTQNFWKILLNNTQRTLWILYWSFRIIIRMHPNRNFRIRKLSCSKLMTNNYNYQPSSNFLLPTEDDPIQFTPSQVRWSQSTQQKLV